MDLAALNDAAAALLANAGDQLAKADPLTIGSAALAALSFVFNWAVVRRQEIAQGLALRAQIEADLMKWGFECIEVLSQCDALARIGASDETTRPAREQLCTKLSTLIDQGRLIFPNQLEHKLGKDRNAAFRGVRPPIQDALVLVHDEISKPRLQGEEFLSFIRACRRVYVSELQKSVAPRVKRALLDRVQRITQVNDQADWAQVADLVEGFERRHDRKFWQIDHPMRGVQRGGFGAPGGRSRQAAE
jgi:hypothetical protein